MNTMYIVRYEDESARYGSGWYGIEHSEFSSGSMGKIAKTKKQAVKDVKKLAKRVSRKKGEGLVKVQVETKDGRVSQKYNYLNGEKA